MLILGCVASEPVLTVSPSVHDYSHIYSDVIGRFSRYLTTVSLFGWSCVLGRPHSEPCAIENVPQLLLVSSRKGLCHASSCLLISVFRHFRVSFARFVTENHVQ